MVEMKLRIVIALGLALGLVAVNVTAQVPVETERYPAENNAEREYGEHTSPNCPDDSTPKFWGVFSDNGGSSWNVIYRCVVN